MNIPAYKRETASGHKNLFSKFWIGGLPHTDKKITKHLLQEIFILVNTEDAADWHRNMTGQINFEGNKYRVTCKSKYRLRSGFTRVRFIGFEIN